MLYARTFLLLTLTVSCAHQEKPLTKQIQELDGSTVVEVRNPYQDEIIKKLSTSKSISAHTVYDNEDKVDSYKKNQTDAILELTKEAHQAKKKLPSRDIASVNLSLGSNILCFPMKTSMLLLRNFSAAAINGKSFKSGIKTTLEEPTDLEAGTVLNYKAKTRISTLVIDEDQLIKNYLLFLRYYWISH